MWFLKKKETIEGIYSRRTFELDQKTNQKEEIRKRETTEFLKTNHRNFDYKELVGQQVLIKSTPNNPIKSAFYCKICEASFNDSIALAEHYKSALRKIKR